METSTVSWPTEFSELKKLDGILRCPICYELMTTSMITSCSHSYCSLCIRKFMQYRTECPICHEETHEVNLRKNRPLDDVINIYSKIKDKLLFTLRLVCATTTNNKSESSTEECTVSKTSINGLTQNKNEETTPNTKNMIDTKRPKKNTSHKPFESPKQSMERAKKPVVQKLFQEEPQSNCSKSLENSSNVEKFIVNGVTIPPIFQSPKCHVSKKPENMALCPVCNVDIPVKNMNLHLDSCLARGNGSDIKPSIKSTKRNALPKRVYDLMKEKDLKKILKGHGLNTNGDRKTMTKRLQRYTVLYNAECDSDNPRPIPELVSQIEREEREEKKNPIFNTLSSRVPVDRNANKEVIEKSNEEYLYFNKSHFDKLIETMNKRAGKYIKPTKPLNQIDSVKDEPSIIIVDPAQPSTSTCDHFMNEIDTVSAPSHDTIGGDEDSDDDMFEKTPLKRKPSFHTIDWIKNEETSEEEIGRNRDQPTSQLTNECAYVSLQHTSPATPERLDVNVNTSPTIPTRNNSNNLSFPGFESDDDEVYESIFDTSRTLKRMCSLSVSKIEKKTKGTQTPESSPVKQEHALEQIFEETGVPEVIVKDEADYDESTIELDVDVVNSVNLGDDIDLEDNSVEEVSSSRTEEESPPPVVTTTFSPIKTRSKRKTVSSEHHLEVSVGEATRKRRKHTNPSMSPEI